MFLTRNDRRQSLSKFPKIPQSDTWLTLQIVPSKVIARVGNKIRVIFVNETKRSVVYRDGGQAEVVCVHHTVSEPDGHPLGQHPRRVAGHLGQQVQVLVSLVLRTGLQNVGEIFPHD